jgi:putative nucleotidyltransferase with HDIG domain
MINIKDQLDNTPHKKLLLIASSVSEDLSIPSYIVGGYVRDLILKRDTTDIDIMVEGDGILFAKKLAKKLNINNIVIYEKFKTALIPYKQVQIEVATARTETYNSDSRKPKVQSTSIDKDLSRRDFTINAIAASLNKNDYGDIIDPFNGINDIKNKLIITPIDVNETLKEDPLRMLRAIRFAAQLNFDIDNKVIDGIKKQRDRLEIISWERITEEIIKSLKTNKPSIAFYLFKETNLLSYIFPEVDIMPGVEIIDGHGHKDVFIHTLQVVDNAAQLTDKMEIRFAALVHDIGKPATKKFFPKKGWTFHGHDSLGSHMLKAISKRMKLSNKLKDYLRLMTRLHLRPIALVKDNITDGAIRRLMVEAGENVDDLMILCRADITTKNEMKIKKYRANFERVEQLMHDVTMRDQMRSFQSPVRGEDIMKELNLKPCKQIGDIKKMIEEAILEGTIENTYEDAFQYMLKIKNTFLKKTS